MPKKSSNFHENQKKPVYPTKVNGSRKSFFLNFRPKTRKNPENTYVLQKLIKKTLPEPGKMRVPQKVFGFSEKFFQIWQGPPLGKPDLEKPFRRTQKPFWGNRNFDWWRQFFLIYLLESSSSPDFSRFWPKIAGAYSFLFCLETISFEFIEFFQNRALKFWIMFK